MENEPTNDFDTNDMGDVRPLEQVPFDDIDAGFSTREEAMRLATQRTEQSEALAEHEYEYEQHQKRLKQTAVLMFLLIVILVIGGAFLLSLLLH